MLRQLLSQNTTMHIEDYDRFFALPKQYDIQLLAPGSYTVTQITVLKFNYCHTLYYVLEYQYNNKLKTKTLQTSTQNQRGPWAAQIQSGLS